MFNLFAYVRKIIALMQSTSYQDIINALSKRRWRWKFHYVIESHMVEWSQRKQIVENHCHIDNCTYLHTYVDVCKLFIIVFCLLCDEMITLISAQVHSK